MSSHKIHLAREKDFFPFRREIIVLNPTIPVLPMETEDNLCHRHTECFHRATFRDLSFLPPAEKVTFLFEHAQRLT